MADTVPAWKVLGATHGGRVAELLAELDTHAQGLQGALDGLRDLLGLPPNHALSARQVVMLVQDEAIKSTLASSLAPDLDPLPDPATLSGAHAREVLAWIADRCTVLAGTVGGSTTDELHRAYRDDDGLLGRTQFSRGLRAVGSPLRKSEIWSRSTTPVSVRRVWNLAVTERPKPRPAPPVAKPAPVADWIDGGAWPGA